MKKPNACRRLADEAVSLALDADLSGEGLDIAALAARFAEAVHGDGEFPPIVLLTRITPAAVRATDAGGWPLRPP